MMEVVFRADASIQIGTGHVMRCLTLADALRGAGAHARFVCRDHPGNLLEEIRRRGYDALPLVRPTSDHAAPQRAPDAPAHADWLGVSWQTDARQTLDALGGVTADCLIVDHYALDARWERAVAGACRRLMAIDDLADRHHEAELLLDQNLGRAAADYRRLLPATSEVLAGPRYALLRPRFAQLRATSLVRRAQAGVRRLLISMGGVDKDNVTGAMLAALHDCALPDDCRITVVLGAHAPCLRQMRASAGRTPWPTEVLVDVADMAALLAECDLAIGAAGTSAWERCCLGLPTLAAVLAANQQAGALALERSGAVVLVEASATDLREKLHAVLTGDCLRRMQQACSSITDGLGVERVLERLTHVHA